MHVEGGEYATYHYDNRGSTVAIANGQGTVTDTFTYGPYGEQCGRTGKTRTPFLYNGRYGVETDNNGLYYMRARYYNPDIKRFINQDVIQGSLDNAITLNHFAYANGNPISYLDPFGLYVANNGVPEDLYERLETEKYQRIKEEKAERQKEIKILNRELEWNQFWGGINIAVCDTTATVTKGFFEGMPCVNIAYANAKGMIGALTAPNFNQSQWEQEFYNAMNSTLLFGITEGIFSYWSGKPVASVGNSISKRVGNTTPNACFVAGTLIAVEEGFKPIEEIKVGEYVWSEDPISGERGLKRVANTFIHDKKQLVYVYIDGKRIDTTGEHPFWVEGKGWILAGELQKGDVLRLKSKENVKVTNIEYIDLEELVKVYNFEVEDWHTYFVSGNNVLVHNKAQINTATNLDIRPTVSNTKLNNLVNDIYKGQNSKILTGNGTTMDSIRYELKTGIPVGGKFHSIKGQNIINGLNNLIKSGKLNASDQKVATTLLQDMIDALSEN